MPGNIVRRQSVPTWLCAALCVLLASACLPPPRPNTPLPDTAGTDAADAATDKDTGTTTDTAVGDTNGKSDTGSTGPVDTADLPSGCTVDPDCLGKPAPNCKVWRCNTGNGKCDVQANAKVNAACDDGNPCTDNDACSPQGQCNFGKAKVCDDNNACTTDTCDQQKGGCVFLNKVDTTCDDGDKCTGAKGTDKCVDGKCVGAPVVCKSQGACKEWSCNPATGECIGKVLEKDNVPCDDGDLCTSKDSCQKSGACIGEKWDKTGQCDDGNACTDENCNPKTGCSSFELVGQTKECTNDGDKCVSAACTGGKCVKSPPKDCSDQDQACSTATCDPGSGQCKFSDKKDGEECVDTAKCIQAKCISGVCADAAAKLECNDGNPCTNDTCVKASKDGGCKNTPNTASCTDGSACTTKDTCKDGACTGDAKDCSDNNECTVDSCDPVTAACSHSDQPDGTKCTGGTCTKGSCG